MSEESTRDELIYSYAVARQQFFAALGGTEISISPIISYSLQGFPSWPVRECWQAVQKEKSTIIFTNGLSDPAEDGFQIGVEVAVETAEKLEDFNAVVSSWAYELVFQASFLVASNPNIRSMYEGKRWGTVELYDVQAPPQYITDKGTIGVLVTVGADGIPTNIQLPKDDALVLVFTPLLKEELDAICGPNRDSCMERIVENLSNQGCFHRISDNRASAL